MIRNTLLARLFDNKFVSSGAWLVALFLILGFSNGWVSAARQCLILAYFASLLGVGMGAVISAAVRFQLSSTGRGLDRWERRGCGRVRKMILRLRRRGSRAR